MKKILALCLIACLTLCLAVPVFAADASNKVGVVEGKRTWLSTFDGTDTWFFGGGAEAVEIAVYYLSVMAAGLSVLYLIYVFRNALQAMGISLWSMVSGIVECAVRVLMAKLVINYIGTDALFLAEPAAWITALLGVLIPYLCLRKRLLRL